MKYLSKGEVRQLYVKIRNSKESLKFKDRDLYSAFKFDDMLFSLSYSYEFDISRVVEIEDLQEAVTENLEENLMISSYEHKQTTLFGQ